jgi:hypothetical protein
MSKEIYVERAPVIRHFEPVEAHGATLVYSQVVNDLNSIGLLGTSKPQWTGVSYTH